MYETLSQGQYTRKCLIGKIKIYKSGIYEEYGEKNNKDCECYPDSEAPRNC